VNTECRRIWTVANRLQCLLLYALHSADDNTNAECVLVWYTPKRFLYSDWFLPSNSFKKRRKGRFPDDNVFFGRNNYKAKSVSRNSAYIYVFFFFWTRHEPLLNSGHAHSAALTISTEQARRDSTAEWTRRDLKHGLLNVPPVCLGTVSKF
jgi:hypothetical protein